jgi:hypothetical protein
VVSVLAAMLALGFAGYSLYLMSPSQFPTVLYLVHEPMWNLLPLSVALGAGYVFFGSWPLLRAALPDLERSIVRVVVHPNTWLALLVLGVQAIVLRLAETSVDVEPGVYKHMLATAIDRLGIFFLAHAVFFGPIVILARTAGHGSAAWRPRWGRGRRSASACCCCCPSAASRGAKRTSFRC